MKTMLNILFAGLVGCTMVTTTSCSEESFDGDPAKNWAGTTESFVPTDEAGFLTY